mgnify:CR=1 FL=1
MSLIERLTGEVIPQQLSKEKEVEILTRRLETMTRQCEYLQKDKDKFKTLANESQREHHGLRQRYEKQVLRVREVETEAQELGDQLKEALNTADVFERKFFEIQHLLYGVIGMLSEQNAETVKYMLEKILHVQTP